MGGGGGKSTQSTVTKTDSENRYQTVNKVFDNAGNVYLQSPAAGTATATTPGPNSQETLLVAAAIIVGALIVSKA